MAEMEIDLCEIFERILYLKKKLRALRKVWFAIAKEKGIDIRQVLHTEQKNSHEHSNSSSAQTFQDSSLLLSEMVVINTSARTYDKGTQTSIDLYNHIEEDLKNHTIAADTFTQTDFITSECVWDSKDLTKDVKSVAENTLNQIGFIFDAKTGTYYDYHNNCHYIPDYKLYYYHQDKCYYYYDSDTKTLKFHSKSDCADQRSDESVDSKSIGCEDQVVKKIKLSDNTDDSFQHHSSHGLTEMSESTSRNIVIESGPKPFVPDHTRHIAPCIRIVVQSTEVSGLKLGSLFIVTCSGGTLGREGAHEVVIPDENVSKMHASFLYEYMQNGCDAYKIVDMGSRNGTFLDGTRLSDTLTTSEPFELVHGSILKVGTTILLCHIHQELETCRDCEPSFTIKHVEPATQVPSKNERETKYKLEVKRLKKKFGLGNNVTVSSVKLPEKYFDRSKNRRDTIGSSHSSEKTHASSLSESIGKTNKGYQLLSKMGWEEGQGLGRGNFEGITTPIMPSGKIGRGGLDSPTTSTDICTKDDFRKALIWKKARNRYANLELLDVMVPSINHNNHDHEEKKVKDDKNKN